MVGSLSLSGCESAGFPKEPKAQFFVPIIEQEFCQDQVCEIKSFCAEYTKDDSDNWVFVQSYALKKCHGVFGISADKFAEYQDFRRKAELWGKENCGPNKNAK